MDRMPRFTMTRTAHCESGAFTMTRTVLRAVLILVIAIIVVLVVLALLGSL